jgi:MFS family permease
MTAVNGRYLWTISLAAALGGLLFGYDWVVIGGAAKFYEAFFHLKDTAVHVAQNASFWEKVTAHAISPVGWAQSCALLGCLGGALASGALSDRFGRKPILIVAAVNFAASSIGIASADTFSVFVIWRILGDLERHNRVALDVRRLRGALDRVPRLIHAGAGEPPLARQGGVARPGPAHARAYRRPGLRGRETG